MTSLHGSQEPKDAPPAEPLDAPEVDINSVGASEKSFPIWIFIAGSLVLITLLAGMVFFVKNSAPFITTAKKEDIPAADADPTAATPKLQPSEPTITAPIAIPKIPQPQASAVSASATGGNNASGNGPCPTTLIIGPDKKPVLDATGIPMAVDCKGVQAPSRAANATSVIVPAAQPGAANAGIQELTDRYHGEIIIAKQARLGNSAATQNAAFQSTLPALPAPPPGTAEILKQLEGLQRGQLTPSAPTNSNPILSTAPAGTRNGAGNTQGNPNSMLAAEKTDRVFAARTIDENTVIPKGTPIDCSLRTRLITEISGFAECQVTRDVYSANGRTLLIERMSIVDGEYASVGVAGQRYIHVLWTRLRKPRGITIDLASPSTDGLGGSGIPATVDNRWVERLGGAYMLSFMKDAIAYETAKNAQTGSSTAGAVAYQNTKQASEDMATKVLNTTIGIKPVLYVNQGDRVGIYVARDLDFSKVYEVRTR
jgi:type IV secretion system protein VirB10